MGLPRGYSVLIAMRVLLACAALLLAGWPEIAAAHAAAPEFATVQQVEDATASDPEDHATSGHCHPGLDCSLTVAFLNPEASVDTQAKDTRFWFSRHENERWRPVFEPPPPRALF